MKKLGSSAYPFTFELPKNAPPSVTLQPGVEAAGKPCGVEYSLRVFVGESMDDRAHKRLIYNYSFDDILFLKHFFFI